MERVERELSSNPLTLAPLVSKYFLKIELSTHTVNLEEDDSSTPNSIVKILIKLNFNLGLSHINKMLKRTAAYGDFKR